MTVRSIVEPSTGRTLKLGRNRPAAEYKLRLKDYVTADMPTHPRGPLNRRQAALPALYNIYANDALGCCVISCEGHVQGVLTGNAGLLQVYKDATIIHEYSAVSGYVPGDESTDNGCDIPTALAYWRDSGFAPPDNRIAGWLSVDGADASECRTAIWLFENLVLGFELPDAWLDPPPPGSGFTWDVAGPPDLQNGHCVAAVDYDTRGPDGRKGLQIDTWGMLGLITNAAVAEYTSPANYGELYAVLSHAGINKAKGLAPSGLNWAQLEADFAAMGGQA